MREASPEAGRVLLPAGLEGLVAGLDRRSVEERRDVLRRLPPGSVYYWDVEDADGRPSNRAACYLVATEEDEKNLKMEAEGEAAAIARNRRRQQNGDAAAGFRGTAMNSETLIERVEEMRD